MSTNYSTPDLSVIEGPANRISQPLTESQLRILFSGAPQFFALSEGHCLGAPHPTVHFPLDTDRSITNLCDHVEIYDDAWNTMAAWPLVTLDVRERMRPDNGHYKEGYYMPLCRERPHMLSKQGLERGTIGYIAALELGVKDTLLAPAPLLGDPFAEDRKRLLDGRGGIRPFTEIRLIESLISTSMTYRNNHDYHLQPVEQLYTDLFSHILFHPIEEFDVYDKHSLQDQINILIDILAIPIWIDFSIVEWRIRLGEVLWGPPIDTSWDDQIFIDEGIAQQLGNQKYFLLLQILLSCELLLRLDAISMNVAEGREMAEPSYAKRIDETATVSLRWSLLLARLWLDNIDLELMSMPNNTADKPYLGWLATLSLAENYGNDAIDAFCYVQMQGRNRERQLSGLLQFAKELRWPNIGGLATKITNEDIVICDNLYTSLATDMRTSTSTQCANSYTLIDISGQIRGKLKRRHASAVFHPAGWLSNSYISGLVLPGEGLNHFLICALLDNDETAISRLGREAILYSGFFYCRKSFWSTACVVGRVLAAGTGASESVGWISSDIIPTGFVDGWVDIAVAQLPLLGNFSLFHFKRPVYCALSYSSVISVSRDATYVEFANMYPINQQKKTA